MQNGILILVLINFGFIALLPRKFFKQNAKLTAQFWVTAAPLFACPAFLAMAYFGVLPALVDMNNPWVNLSGLVGVVISTLSILELGMAIGTHRVPIHMFHDQEDRKVSHLVTYGPYKYIRHPIYSSYLLALFAAVLYCPQVGTIACYLYGLFILTRTAAAEEQRLSQPSAFGPEYVDYMKRTRRFLPPLSALTLGGDKKEQEPPASVEPQSSGLQATQR